MQKLIYNQPELEQQVAEFHLVSSLTGNFQKTNKPKIINIRDITQDTVGLLILNSVINIYLLIGFIFP